MQHLSLQNFFSLFAPLLATFWSTGSQGSHFQEDKFHIGPVGSWCQCKFVPGPIPKWWQEEVPVFYFCIILSCFPDNGARKTWNQGQFSVLFISQQQIKTQGPPCWPNFSLMICGLFCNPQVPGGLHPYLQARLCLLLGDCFRARSIASEVYCQQRSSSLCWQRYFLSVISLPDIWCVSIMCVLLEAKCHSSRSTFCPSFPSHFRNEFRFSG